jgi:hypothetical protein
MLTRKGNENHTALTTSQLYRYLIISNCDLHEQCSECVNAGVKVPLPSGVTHICFV